MTVRAVLGEVVGSTAIAGIAARCSSGRWGELPIRVMSGPPERASTAVEAAHGHGEVEVLEACGAQGQTLPEPAGNYWLYGFS
jgi:hypothetical protein